MEVVILNKAELKDLLNQAASQAVAELRDDLEQARTPEVMTKAELAEYLRCDISKINRLMKKGLPRLLFGSTPRFRKTEIDRWLNDLQKIQGQENNDPQQGLE